MLRFIGFVLCILIITNIIIVLYYVFYFITIIIVLAVVFCQIMIHIEGVVIEVIGVILLHNVSGK